MSTFGGIEKYRVCLESSLIGLTSETVESSALSLEGVDDVQCSDSFSAGVFSVGHSVADDVLEEDLKYATSLLIDQTGDTLDTASSRETADGGLGDTLDVIAKYLAMAFGSALS
jgi:hypothetical protein